ncbi:FRG domain-containing protein [Spirosoma sp. KUDC1026]|uniref:FRG domain-containing protein n=1 Tax=Spirosoma sp. KUDC1026 TaxID=2745947 RepID=UPI00159B8EBB|nr:FRG domain-containing protein [Spirosoma sp. KUDC1026]QKZ14331.1 FRG domain-containing protein [Spirosoma sp. KUDC1026]
MTEANSFTDFLSKVGALVDNKANHFVLFRGQSDEKNLLPGIARDDNTIDTTEIEKQMLEDFERRSPMLISSLGLKDDWDRLVYAQHFGLKTRLLDWTSNPLAAIWFATNRDAQLNTNKETDSFIYAIYGTKDLVIDPRNDKSPFDLKLTRVLRPTLNNPRIVAQSGWFTIHRYYDGKKFVPLEDNIDFKGGVEKFVIPAGKNKEFFKQALLLGVSAKSLFPDVEGLCRHLNWKYLTSKKP